MSGAGRRREGARGGTSGELPSSRLCVGCRRKLLRELRTNCTVTSMAPIRRKASLPLSDSNPQDSKVCSSEPLPCLFVSTSVNLGVHGCDLRVRRKHLCFARFTWFGIGSSPAHCLGVLGCWEFGSSHGSPCDSRGSHGWEFGSSARSHGFARFTLVFCAVHMVGDWNLKYLKEGSLSFPCVVHFRKTTRLLAGVIFEILTAVHLVLYVWSTFNQKKRE